MVVVVVVGGDFSPHFFGDFLVFHLIHTKVFRMFL